MWTIIRRSLARSRGQILGWGIGLALLAAYLGSFYDTLAAQGESYQALLGSMPPQLMAFFGDVTDMFTPVGYLTVYFFSYMPIVIGIFPVLAGSGLLASDEEAGTLDLVLAQPISRTRLFLGRVAGFVIGMTLILTMSWLGLAVTAPGSGLALGIGRLALPQVSFLAYLLVVGMLALLLSMLLPSRSTAATVSGLFLVGNYFVDSWTSLEPGLEPIAAVLPLAYLQGGRALEGLDWGSLGILLGAALAMGLLAWWRFQRRDIRVAGEGSWRLPGRGRPTAR